MQKENIENFYKHLIENLIPDNVTQEAAGHGEERYTADNWTMDMCRCMIEGTDSFRKEVPPEFKDSPGYINNLIISHVKLKYKAYEHLKKIKDDADVLCIGEVGRGLDILISQMVKEWEWIICYDHNPIYKEYLNRYFYYDMTFHGVSSSYFLKENHNMIKDKTIMVINHSNLRQFDIIKKNKNIVHLIFDGEIKW